MRSLTFLKHNVHQRITAENVLTRIGKLEGDNIGTIVRGIVGVGNLLIKGGNFSLTTGLSFEIDADSFWIQEKNSDESYFIPQKDSIELTVDSGDLQVRYDLIEGRYKLVDSNLKSVNIIDPVSGTITSQNYYIDKKVELEVFVRKGTPGAGVCPDITASDVARITGTVDLSSPIDLSSNYNLKFAIDSGNYIVVDCRGATPSSTTLAEIITNINTAYGSTIAYDVGGYLEIRSILTGDNGRIEFVPPISNDCINETLGLAEAPNYTYVYIGENAFFKLGEIRVPISALSLVNDDLRDIDRKGEWTKDSTTISRIDNVYGIFNSSASNTNIRLLNQSIEGTVSVKDPVYYNTTNSRWEKASSINSPIGMCTDLATNEIVLAGKKSGLSGLTPGQIYMDDSGNLTSSQTRFEIGYAQSATELIVKININKNDFEIYIDSQQLFESYFGTGNEPIGTGTTQKGWAYSCAVLGQVEVIIPNDTSIVLKPNPTDGTINHSKYTASSGFTLKAYSLKTRIRFFNRISIKSQGEGNAIIVKNSAWVKLISLVHATTPNTCVSTLDSNIIQIPLAYGPLKAGTVIWLTSPNKKGNNFYRVINGYNSITYSVVELDCAVNATSSSNVMRMCVSNINIDVILDGNGILSNSGGILYLDYCADANFKEVIRGSSNEDAASYNNCRGGNAILSNCYNVKIKSYGAYSYRLIDILGVASGILGGSIYMENCHFCDIEDFGATSYIGMAGTIGLDGKFIYGAAVYMMNSSYNKIRVNGALGYSDSSANRILSTTLFGGGVYALGCSYNDIFVTDAMLRNNQTFSDAGSLSFSALCYGAGVYFDANSSDCKHNTVNVDSCYCYINAATTLGGGSSTVRSYGGGVYAFAGVFYENDINVSNCKIYANLTITGGTASRTAYGSGVSIEGYGYNNRIKVDRCESNINTGNTHGGGVHLANGARNNIAYVFGCNSITGYGAGAYLDGSATVVSKNKIYVTLCSSYRGGGIYANNVELSILEARNCICPNLGGIAGGLYIENNSRENDINILDCTCSNGTAGGAYINGFSAVIEKNKFTIIGCTANTAGGAYIYYANNNEFVIKRCSTTLSNGGGAYILSSNRNEFLIQNCTAAAQGGAAYLLTSLGSPSNNVFTDIQNCTAASGGGGIQIQVNANTYTLCLGMWTGNSPNNILCGFPVATYAVQGCINTTLYAQTAWQSATL